MNITEILITAYDGDTEVFATSLMTDHAKTIFAATDDRTCPTVGSIREVITDALNPVVQILEDLGVVLQPEPVASAK